MSSPITGAASGFKAFVYLLPSLWLWFSLFLALAPEWLTNAQYSHGFLVPILGLVLLKQRWTNRPSASSEPALRPVWSGLVVLGVLSYLPLRWLEEANPEWRLLLWIHGWVAAMVTIAQVGRVGGWRWTRFFLFVMVWPWIGIPWPTGLENFVVQELTRAAATLTAELANLAGIPAFQQGNVIEIRSGVVGIEEACSGVRSLQAALLGSLFMGEFLRLSIARRGLLLGIGFLVAFVANVARTFTLVFIADRKSLHQAEVAHDTVALIAMGVGLGGLFLASRWLEKRSVANVTDSQPSVSPSSQQALPLMLALSRGQLGMILVWMLGATLLVEVWYLRTERSLVTQSRFWVDETRMDHPVTRVTIPEKTRAMLRYGAAKALAWQEANGDEWRLYWLRWDAGRNSAQLARAHTPDICLTGTGGKIVQRWNQKTFAVAGMELVFDQYQFRFGQRDMHVFYCLWPDRETASPGSTHSTNLASDDDGSPRSRVQAAWGGRRNLGQTVLEVAVIGPRDPEEARASLHEQLARWIQKTSDKVSVAKKLPARNNFPLGPQPLTSDDPILVVTLTHHP